MKRGRTKKVKAVPACAASNDALEGRFKPVQPKIKRRVRTSVAMVGLVISMGAPNLLLTRQSDRAPAAEAIGKETIPSVPAATPEATQSDNINSVELQAVPVPVVTSSSAVVPPITQVQQAATPAPSVSEYPVQKTHSRVVTQKYQVEADPAMLSVRPGEQRYSASNGISDSNLMQSKALASSEDVKIKIAPTNSNTQHTEIQAEEVLKSYRVNRLVQKLKDAQSETLSKSDEVKSTQITPTAAPAVVEPIVDESGTFNVIDSAISTKQRVLINRLKQKSNSSQYTLSHLKRSEESNNPSVVTTLGQPSPLPKVNSNQASLAPAVVEVERPNGALLSPDSVTSNENSEFDLQQSQDSAAVRTSKKQDLAAHSRNEASVESVVVDAKGQNAALLLPTSVRSENSGFELQQLPPAAVGILNGDPAPNAATIAPTGVDNPAGEDVVQALKGKPPYSSSGILRQAASPIGTSNENSGFELQQSPSAAAVGILNGSDPAPNAVTIAPTGVDNPAGENVARALRGKPPYSPSGIPRQVAAPVVTSNEDTVLEAQNVQPTPSSVVVVPDVQDTVVNEPTVVGAASLGYQVKAGDTLSAIARNHGIPLSEIVKANQLRNPDLIEINQQITIPAFQHSSAVGQTITAINRPTQSATTAATVASEQKAVLSQSVFVVPPLSPIANNSSVSVSTLPMTDKIQTHTELIASNPAGAQQEIGILPEPPAEIPSPGAAYSGMGGSLDENQLSTPAAYSGMGGSISDENQLSTAAYSQSQSPNSTKLKSQSDLYVQDLQTDIQKLQQKYYAQHRGSQIVPIVNETTNVSAPAQVPGRATVAIRSQGNPQTLPNASANQPINPEFRVAQATEVLQPNLQKQSSTQINSAVRSKTKARVATAPSNVDASEAMQSFRGRHVSPDLPPLGAVDTYLPKPTTLPLKGYIWPAKGVLTSGYGWRWGRMHKGIDVAAPIGTPIVAAAPGVVVRAGWNSGGYGKLVDIKHADGTLTRYAHNNRILVQAGQEVDQGQRISEMGSTGFSTGPHLHFEVHPGGKRAVNPIALLPGR